jgi:mono/diheme cytochrome c family protein
MRGTFASRQILESFLFTARLLVILTTDGEVRTRDVERHTRAPGIDIALIMTRVNDMSALRSLVLPALLFCAPLLVLTAGAQPNTVSPNPRLLNAELITRGAVVYRNHCAGCHGAKGDGNGPGAYGLNPRPRDFTTGIFKFRSTPQGMLPTDEDLVRTIQQGIPGTSMPAYDLMPARDVLAVAQYLKVFSERWQDPESHAPPLAIPPPPAWMQNAEERQTRISKAKDFYTSSCAPCHGAQADGKGPAAALMMDSWGSAIIPADLRRPYIRSGRTLSDIYKALVTGVNGTPMPSFVGLMTEDQKWELVAFIDELRRERRGLRPPGALPLLDTTAPAATQETDASDYE